jgi:dolichyl-phosphate beta-glucosyltransferase
MIDVSIIIPAYNEENRLPLNILKIKNFLDKQKLNFEVIVVVEKSIDRTVELTKKSVGQDKRFKIVANKIHRGKGHAVKQGMLMAKGKYLFFMDADLSTSLSAIERFVEYFDLNGSVDLILGSREHPKSSIIMKQNIIRRNMGKIFNYFVRQLVHIGIKDTQCGFKAYRYDVAQNLFRLQSIDGFSFDVENLALAQKLNYKVAVLPVVWKNYAGSKVQILGGSWQMLKDLYTIRRNLKRDSNSQPTLNAMSENSADSKLIA